MKSGVQYFALHEETVEWVRIIAEKHHNVRCVLLHQHYPYCLEEVDITSLDTAVLLQYMSPVLLVGIHEPVLGEPDLMKFCDASPGWCSIRFSRPTENTPPWSWMSFMSDVPEQIRFGSALIRLAKKHMKRGVWSFNTQTLQSHFNDSLYYSPGAEKYLRIDGSVPRTNPLIYSIEPLSK